MTKMKIGIMTFHWATNYGAVLQAYALQQYLINEGLDAVIVNYIPKKLEVSIVNCLRSRSISAFLAKIKVYKKELRIRRFRADNLILSKRYTTCKQINLGFSNLVDLVITGSDQVWNQFFLANSGDTKFNTAYFLSCFSGDIPKIAYAVSFGCIEYSRGISEKVAPLLNDFNAIGVRENSGKQILKTMNYESSSVVCDPTLLLEPSQYYSLFSKHKSQGKFTFIYLLRDTEGLALDKAKNTFDLTNAKVSSDECLESWLANIFHSDFVVTNSYHGMIFSILFEKDFAVLLEKDEPMNDRFYTLLSKLNLLDRVCYLDDSVFDCKKEIPWKEVKENLNVYIKHSKLYLLSSIKSLKK